jgi:hypothetical protein
MNAVNLGNIRSERQNRAIQKLIEKMSRIPESDEIASAMTMDWVNNVVPEDLAEMKYEDIRELVEGIYRDEGLNPPFTNDDYKQMFNFFTVFVRDYHGGEEPIIQGGKRRRLSKKRRQTKKKTRRGPKKTRRHK